MNEVWVSVFTILHNWAKFLPSPIAMFKKPIQFLPQRISAAFHWAQSESQNSISKLAPHALLVTHNAQKIPLPNIH